MTLDEFNKWFAHFVTAFPDAKAHVLKDGKGGKAAMGMWFSVLEKRSISDALAVTNGLFEGVHPIPWIDKGGYPDWSSVPRHVSRLCAEMHPVEPGWKQHTRERVKPGIIESDKSMAAAFKRTQEIFAEGGTMDDVRAYLDELYGTGSRASAKPNHEPAFDEWNGA